MQTHADEHFRLRHDVFYGWLDLANAYMLLPSEFHKDDPPVYFCEKSYPIAERISEFMVRNLLLHSNLSKASYLTCEIESERVFGELRSTLGQLYPQCAVRGNQFPNTSFCIFEENDLLVDLQFDSDVLKSGYLTVAVKTIRTLNSVPKSIRAKLT